MRFLFHNKLTIKSNGKVIEFYNNMFESVYTKLSVLDSYFNCISFGNGSLNNNQNEFKLSNYLATYKLDIETGNSDISNGVLFSKKYSLIGDSKLDNKYITEAGIASSFEDNPTIYNYFSLVNSEYPNGIKKEKGIPLEIEICIYLTITNQTSTLLTAGENPFIKFLLGEGLANKNIYAVRGNLLLDNDILKREKPNLSNRVLCSLAVTKSDGLNLTFSADLLTGETHEIVFLAGDEPFARINVERQKPEIVATENFTPKTNYVIDLGSNIIDASTVINTSTNNTETDIYLSKYATDFGDKITLPFHNMFDNETPRFLSKDGNKIFFVVEDTIYAYINEKYKIKPINTLETNVQNLIKIISFDNYVFIITRTYPYISAFKIIDYKLSPISLNFSAFEYLNDFDKIFDIDITLSKNGIFMLGYILNSNYSGHVVYFKFNEQLNTFDFDSYQKSEYRFTYLLAMYKNNFSDASIIFLKGGEFSYDCKIVTFLPDKTFTDVYNVLCYYYTKDTKEIYTKGRAVVVEKTISPNLWIYFYPQIYRYNLSILGDELDDFVSTNMLYLIQKKENNNYEIYNLVGYDTPTKFHNNFPKEIDQSKIESFEFLNDTLLIFLSNEEKIIAYNLKEDAMLIENVSSNNDTYSITYNKYNLIGSNNEGVIATFSINIKI